MHRAFRDPPPVSDLAGAHVAELRAFLRSLGLGEREQGGAYLYSCVHAGGGRREFATLHGRRRNVTIYLYPDALGRGAGYATRFYRLLDDADLGMGSKAGPSIGIDLDDERQVRLFREGLTALLAAGDVQAGWPVPG